MAGRIPQHFIDELIQRADIVELIDSRVPLKKAGKDYTACCPFHNEKTPSFTVSPDKQFYHCFGCGAHGTAIGFLMEYDNMDFLEAVQELADKLGLEVPREGGQESAPAPAKIDRTDDYAILEQASRYYRQQLKQHERGPDAIAYLKQRGLSGEIAKEFAIGYAPPGWDNLLKALGHQQRLQEQGMVIQKEDGRAYDRFRDRIMFPIHDRRGRVIGFGGRVLGDDTPKYLNSPETPLFHKGRELYGLFQARQQRGGLQHLLVVEGYMDVVALAQFGIRNAVATLGTAVTPEHLEAMFRVVPEVVFCFDGDRAGREAAWRGLENALGMMKSGRSLRFLFLPDGEDPDTLVRGIGAQAFSEMVEGAGPLSSFMLERLQEQVDMGSIDGRARLADKARPLLEKLQDPVFKRMLTQQLAERCRIPYQELQAMLGGGTASGGYHRAPVGRKVTGQGQRPSLVRTAISSLLQEPQLGRTVENIDGFAQLQQPGVRLLVELIEYIQADPHVCPSTAAILEHWRGSQEGGYLQQMTTSGNLLGSEGNWAGEFEGALRELVRQQRAQRREYLSVKPFTQLSDEEKSELSALLKQV